MTRAVSSSHMKRILIVGGGFVGLRAARLLAKKADVTLVSMTSNFTFTPWLVDLLAGDLKLKDITADLGEIAKRDGFKFIKGKATRIDRDQKKAEVETSKGSMVIDFDAVALCQGASTNFFNIPGAEEYTHQIKTPEHVEALKVKLASINGPVSVCVVGAGPTGVETAFAILDHFGQTKRTGKLMILQAAPTILPGFSNRLIDNARRHLTNAGVSIMEGDPATAVDATGVTLKSGKRVECQVIVWAGGIKPNMVEIAPTLPSDKSGCISVDRSLEASHETFAAGDACAIVEPETPTPKTAQAAMEMAPMLAKNVMRELENQPLQPFVYHSKGVILTAGHTAMLEEGKISLSSPIFNLARYILYRFRFWQMTGR